MGLTGIVLLFMNNCPKTHGLQVVKLCMLSVMPYCTINYIFHFKLFYKGPLKIFFNLIFNASVRYIAGEKTFFLQSKTFFAFK